MFEWLLIMLRGLLLFFLSFLFFFEGVSCCVDALRRLSVWRGGFVLFLRERCIVYGVVGYVVRME